MKPILIIFTVDKRSEGLKIGKLLLSRKLIAAIQVHGPIESHFWWKGRVQKAKEWSCEALTTTRNYKKIEKAIRENHSYEVPQIVAVPIEKISPDYLRWLKESTRVAP